MAPTWIIDGRGGFAGYEHGEGIVQRLTDSASKDEEALADMDMDAFTIGTTETGQPGDEYDVLLQVKGKWRMITWKKVSRAERAELPAGSSGTYYLAGSWNEWGLEEMHSDPSTPGLFTGEIRLPLAGSADFQIIRDMDWGQQFYPNPEAASLDDPDSVLGPDDLGYEFSWWRVEGRPGDKFSVHFQRSYATDGSEFRRVSWQLVDDDAALADAGERTAVLEAPALADTTQQPASAEEPPAVETAEQRTVTEDTIPAEAAEQPAESHSDR